MGKSLVMKHRRPALQRDRTTERGQEEGEGEEGGKRHGQQIALWPLFPPGSVFRD